jgi:hypothetical protein
VNARGKSTVQAVLGAEPAARPDIVVRWTDLLTEIQRETEE